MIADHNVPVFEASVAPPERVKFKLAVTASDGKRIIHDFELPGRLSAGAQLWLAQFAPNPDGTSSADVFAIMGFFQRALPPGEFARFEAVVNDPESAVELAALGAILSYVVEKTTGVPTERLSGSTPGQPASGPTWMPPPSPPVSTYSLSPQPVT